MHRHRIAAALLAALTTTTGCAGHIYNVWRDSSFNGPPIRHVLVLAPRSDPGERRIWEDAYVAGLEEHGIKATSSWGLFPDQVPTAAQLAEVVTRDAYDGLLVSTRFPDIAEE